MNVPWNMHSPLSPHTYSYAVNWKKTPRPREFKLMSLWQSWDETNSKTSFTGVNCFQTTGQKHRTAGPAVHLFSTLHFSVPSTAIWYTALPTILILLCLHPLPLTGMTALNEQQAYEEEEGYGNDENVTVQREPWTACLQRFAPLPAVSWMKQQRCLRTATHSKTNQK